MRTLWKGAISFGLVNIPVKMYTATERKNIQFNQLHAPCKTPIQYRKYCPVCQKEVGADELVRGYEYEKGRYVILRDEDFEMLPGENTKTIDILDFVALAEIDPVYFDRSYYLGPSPGGEKAYSLLNQAMHETGKIAIAQVMIRSKAALACLRPWEKLIVMATMFFPDEIRAPELLTAEFKAVKLHPNEISMANSLIGNLSTTFNPEKYTNEYRSKLMEVIQAKIAGEEVAVPTAPETAKVVDLMEALRASLEATEAQKKSTKKRKKKQTG
ncbi:MAG: Ku protein [Firmicutes bacterium]|nr:Ku protein [Bacillota bacterium]